MCSHFLRGRLSVQNKWRHVLRAAAMAFLKRSSASTGLAAALCFGLEPLVPMVESWGMKPGPKELGNRCHSRRAPFFLSDPASFPSTTMKRGKEALSKDHERRGKRRRRGLFVRVSGRGSVPHAVPLRVQPPLYRDDISLRR